MQATVKKEARSVFARSSLPPKRRTMFDFFERILDSSDFVPRGQGGQWSPALITLHVVADLLIWLAWCAIPISLLVLIRGRKLPYRRLWWWFGICIFLCGLTH